MGAPLDPCPGPDCPGYRNWSGVGAVPAGHLIYAGILSHVRRDQYAPETLARNAELRAALKGQRS